MKRFLLTGLLILGLGQFATYAQQRGTYNDDIYYNSKDAKKEAEIRKQKAAEAAAAREAARANEEQERENTYSSSGSEAGDPGDAATYRRSYQTDADVDGDGYLDANDDYFYTSRVRRFSYNAWGGYYSPFYDPFWYGPGYYGGSGISVTIGWGPSWGYGPGWGYPYGGWGYPYYGWGYPYGGYGWGSPYCGPGWGYGYGYPYYGGGYWSGYNHGFYDGYHYGGGYGAPRSVYGPRRSVSSSSYGPRSTGGTLPSSGGLIRQQRMAAPENGNAVIANDPRPAMRSTRELPERAIQNPNAGAVERSRRFEPSEPAQQQIPERSSMRRGRIFGGQNSQMENSGRVEQRQQQPAYEQRQQRSYEQPRYQQSAPSRMQSSPSMGSPRGGSFGGGGGSFGSGGGGGRRR